MPASGVLKAAATRRHVPDGEHDGGAYLHSRPFAADRGAAQQAEQGQKNLADGDANRHQAAAGRLVGELPRGDCLRNAAPLRILEIAIGEEHRQHEAGGRDHE